VLTTGAAVAADAAELAPVVPETAVGWGAVEVAGGDAAGGAWRQA